MLNVMRMYDLGFGVLLRTVGHLDHGSELFDRCEEAGDILRAGHADMSSCLVVLEVSLLFHRY